jgi:hypothetical protein
MRSVLATAVIAFAAAMLGAVIAWADEQACHRDGDTVVCTGDGFAKLVDATLDFKSRAQTAEVKLAARDLDLSDAKVALDTCIAAKPRPPVSSTLLAYAAGMIGTAMTAFSPRVQSPTTQSALLGVGLVLIGGGAAFVIP